MKRRILLYMSGAWTASTLLTRGARADDWEERGVPGRVIFHSVADVFTLGLWEVVGTPTETIFSGSEMAFQVSYDDDDHVEEVIVLKKK